MTSRSGTWSTWKRGHIGLSRTRRRRPIRRALVRQRPRPASPGHRGNRLVPAVDARRADRPRRVAVPLPSPASGQRQSRRLRTRAAAAKSQRSGFNRRVQTARLTPSRSTSASTWGVFAERLAATDFPVAVRSCGVPPVLEGSSRPCQPGMPGSSRHHPAGKHRGLRAGREVQVLADENQLLATVADAFLPVPHDRPRALFVLCHCPVGTKRHQRPARPSASGRRPATSCQPRGAGWRARKPLGAAAAPAQRIVREGVEARGWNGRRAR